MVDFIHSAHHHGWLALAIHVIANVALGFLMVLLVYFFKTPWLAIGLLLISKWRVLAVRPRYWWANILSSLPDLVVGLSVIMLATYVGNTYENLIRNGLPPTMGTMFWSFNVNALEVQLGIATLYAIWLAWIKPLSSERAVLFQASVCELFGLMVIYTLSKETLWLALVLTFVVAFSAARQALGQYDEKSRSLLASVWGVLVTILGYACWHWNVMYPVISLLILLPQIVIFVAMISFVTIKVYKAWADDRHVTWEELGAPVVFALAMTVVLLIFFSRLFELPIQP